MSRRSARCPPWVDAVDKVGDEQRAGNNRIQVPGFLNQCCAPDSYLESMLLTRPSKTFFDSIGTESARDHLHAERGSQIVIESRRRHYSAVRPVPAWRSPFLLPCWGSLQAKPP